MTSNAQRSLEVVIKSSQRLLVAVGKIVGNTKLDHDGRKKQSKLSQIFEQKSSANLLRVFHLCTCQAIQKIIWFCRSRNFRARAYCRIVMFSIHKKILYDWGDAHNVRDKSSHKQPLFFGFITISDLVYTDNTQSKKLKKILIIEFIILFSILFKHGVNNVRIRSDFKIKKNYYYRMLATDWNSQCLFLLRCFLGCKW